MHDHSHHEFAYNEADRLQRQNPVDILSRIGLGPNMVMIDVGSNDGYFTIPAAKLVGSGGHIFAVDVSELAIQKLNEKLKLASITNCTTLTAKAEETIFVEAKADLVFMGTVLHDFEDPEKVLINARKMLKKNGKLVNLDWRKKKTDMGPPLEKRFSKDKASKMVEAAGLKIIKLQNYDDNYYLIEAVITK